MFFVNTLISIFFIHFSTIFYFVHCYYNNGGATIKGNKNYGIILLAVLIGVIFSNLLFSSYEDEMVMKSEGNVYLLQYGIYTTKNVLNENIKKLTDYVIYENDSKYYVYLGVFINYENANKVSRLLENENIYTYIKNDYLSDTSIVKKIGILDNKLSLLNKESEIKDINKKMLELYKSFLN